MPASNDSLGETPNLAQVLERIEEHLAAIRAENGKSPKEWLTVNEVAEELKVSRDIVERLIGTGQLPASQISGKGKAAGRRMKRIQREAVDQFMKANQTHGQNGRSPRLRHSQPTRSKDYFA